MRRTNFYVDPEKLRTLKMVAASEGGSVSDLVREAIDEIIDKRLRARADSRTGTAPGLAATLLDDVMRRVDAGTRADVPEAELQRDVDEAINDVRAERRARRRRRSETPRSAAGNE